MTETSLGTPSLNDRVRQSLDDLRSELLSQRTPNGHWLGELSASSLSTATAVSAIAAYQLHRAGESASASKTANLKQVLDSTPNGIDDEALTAAITRGINALKNQQNKDGGFGDTDRSHSNIATSYLVLAASSLAKKAMGHSLADNQVEMLDQYIEKAGGFDALRERYGTDKTFVVPILTNLAIAGIVSWDKVPALPFEAAAFPQSMYRMLQMPVVSYAIPALVAIGQTRHFHGPKAFLPLRLFRKSMIQRTLNVLSRMQPESGGYLEATPLTAFVVMSLAVTGRTNHPVSEKGIRFLLDSITPEGLWPIDTNLATWVTSLSMHALACDPDDDGKWCTKSLVKWHLKCQHLIRHPFTGAEPGGWGWSDLSGAVPDSDDTPAAILALATASHWNKDFEGEIKQAIAAAVHWLDQLQNRNGGWPTFCRGWGKLPFDRSSNDLTAHALRAIKTASDLGVTKIDKKQVQRAKAFLAKNQEPDGSWLPLWFGNQDREDESNPIYGTAKVLNAAVHFLDKPLIDRGCQYLITEQNPDGGWGGGMSMTSWLANLSPQTKADQSSSANCEMGITSSMEETALAVDALLTVARSRYQSVKSDSTNSDSYKNKLGDEEQKRINTQAESYDAPYENRYKDSNQTSLRDTMTTTKDDTVNNSGANSSGHPLPNTGGMAVKVPVETAEKSIGDRFTGESSSLSAPYAGKDALSESIIKGVEFLVKGLESDRHQVAWPIGFYFAKLWYHEKLYPHIFTASALGKFLRTSSDSSDSDWPL